MVTFPSALRTAGFRATVPSPVRPVPICLSDMGVGWVIIGHSERRGKGEADAEVAAKAKYALDKGLKVIACCGEPLESREAGTTNDFVFPQIKAYADAFSKEDWKNVVIACKYSAIIS